MDWWVYSQLKVFSLRCKNPFIFRVYLSLIYPEQCDLFGHSQPLTALWKLYRISRNIHGCSFEPLSWRRGFPQTKKKHYLVCPACVNTIYSRNDLQQHISVLTFSSINQNDCLSRVKGTLCMSAGCGAAAAQLSPSPLWLFNFCFQSLNCDMWLNNICVWMCPEKVLFVHTADRKHWQTACHKSVR